MSQELELTYVGGPTLLIEFGGLRLLTDPTFDEPGREYHNGPVRLHKIAPPALTPDEIGPVDAVLLSHDHHHDNLDHSGREFLSRVSRVFTTQEGAERLGGNAVGLTDWQEAELVSPSGSKLRVVATPVRHGPAGLNRGQVQGFILYFDDAPEDKIYVSGDTVWYEGVAEVARRFPAKIAILHLGAARVPAIGEFHLTMTASEGVEAARAFPNATIVPIHFEGWKHFSEGQREIIKAFAENELEHRLTWLEAGRAVSLPV